MLNIRIDYTRNTSFINLIKVVRAFSQMGLKDSKEYVEAQGINNQGTGRVGSFLVNNALSFSSSQVLMEKYNNGVEYIHISNVSDRKHDGSHIFEFPNTPSSDDTISNLRLALNDKKYKLSVKKHQDWIGVKIHRKKGGKKC